MPVHDANTLEVQLRALKDFLPTVRTSSHYSDIVETQRKGFEQLLAKVTITKEEGTRLVQASDLCWPAVVAARVAGQLGLRVGASSQDDDQMNFEMMYNFFPEELWNHIKNENPSLFIQALHEMSIFLNQRLGVRGQVTEATYACMQGIAMIGCNVQSQQSDRQKYD